MVVKKSAVPVKIESEALDLVTVAEKSLTVRTAEDYKAAASVRQKIKDMMKKVDASFDPIIASCYAAHQKAIAQKREIYAPLENARKAIKAAMGVYDAEQARIAAEAKKVLEESMKEELGDTTCLPPVDVKKDVPKVAGGPVFQTIWKAKIVDFPSLIAAVAAGMVPEEALLPNTAWLRKQAVAQHEKMNIPGTQAYSEKV